MGSADELLKFKQLLDAGAITQEEYDTKKRQILGAPAVATASSWQSSSADAAGKTSFCPGCKGVMGPSDQRYVGQYVTYCSESCAKEQEKKMSRIAGVIIVGFICGFAYFVWHLKNGPTYYPPAPQSTTEAAVPASNPTPADSLPSGYLLEVQSWTWGIDHESDYVTASGEVKNISGKPLDYIQVSLTLRDNAGNLVHTDSLYIEDWKMLNPDAVSRFKLMFPYKSSMKGAKGELSFRREGQSIEFRAK